MTVRIFDNDDNKYLEWMSTHPNSFIVNTRCVKNSGYFVLHKPGCFHITVYGTLTKDAFTEREYIKIGSDDINELKNWFEKNNLKFKGRFAECKTCKPL
jgi:hypothetical protein